MSQSQTLEHLCHEIVQMEVSSRIRAIELILHSLEQSATDTSPAPQKRGRLSELKGIGAESNSAPPKRGRLSELEGIGKGTWEGMDIDQFIREERDSWDS
jgi:hypothetical protein